jgi:hypothetical protein
MVLNGMAVNSAAEALATRAKAAKRGLMVRWRLAASPEGAMPGKVPFAAPAFSNHGP